MSSKVIYKKGPNKPIFKFFSEKCVTKYCVLAGMVISIADAVAGCH